MKLVINGSDGERSTLYEKIADSLESSILECNESSVKLPTENELALKFGVSRAVIRESLNILRERGLIVTKVGEGTFTEKPSYDFLARNINRMIRMNGISDRDVNSIRLILECGSSRLAALNVTDSFISSLEEITDEMEASADDIEKRVRLDFEFHLLIAKESGNELLVLFIESINEILLDYIRRRLIQKPEGHLDGVIWHRRITDLFRRKSSPDEVESAMRKHLESSFHQI